MKSKEWSADSTAQLVAEAEIRTLLHKYYGSIPPQKYGLRDESAVVVDGLNRKNCWSTIWVADWYEFSMGAE